MAVYGGHILRREGIGMNFYLDALCVELFEHRNARVIRYEIGITHQKLLLGSRHDLKNRIEQICTNSITLRAVG